MTLPLRPEDYPDPNWCPDCGEPRGVCRCLEMQGDDWNPDYNYDDDLDEYCCNVCGAYYGESHAESCPQYGIVP